MNDITKRLLEYYNYLLENEIVANGNDFAKKIGISSSMFTEISKGRTNAGLNVIQKTVIQFRPNVEWLLTGEGDMVDEKHANTPHASAAIVAESGGNKTYNPRKNALSDAPPNAPPSAPPTQDITRNDSTGYNLGMPHVVTVDNSNKNSVSLVGVRARAGYLSGYADPEYIEKLPSYSMPGLNNATFRAFEIEGVSMSPTLKPHDIVIAQWVESLSEIREDRVHIVVTKHDGIVIKRLLNRIDKYGFIIGKSDAVDNRHNYPNINIRPEDVLELWYAKLLISSDFKAPGDLFRRINDLEAGLHYLLQKDKKALV